MLKPYGEPYASLKLAKDLFLRDEKIGTELENSNGTD